MIIGRDAEPGAGLGLSMVHGLAVQVGGALTIESTFGAGTTITIWLPESRGQREREEQVQDSSEPVRLIGSVFLVDNKEHIRVIAAEMLTELGLKVRGVDPAAAALKVLDEGLQPDLLITEHLMPALTGMELARTVQTRLPRTKILIVSGFAEEEGLDSSIPRLTKPFVQDELIAALCRLEMAIAKSCLVPAR